jgi:hypothetical protein
MKKECGSVYIQHGRQDKVLLTNNMHIQFFFFFLRDPLLSAMVSVFNTARIQSEYGAVQNFICCVSWAVRLCLLLIEFQRTGSKVYGNLTRYFYTYYFKNNLLNKA